MGTKESNIEEISVLDRKLFKQLTEILKMIVVDKRIPKHVREDYCNELNAIING